MKTIEDRKQELIAKIKQWIIEKPECIWLQEAVRQLQYYGQISKDRH